MTVLKYRWCCDTNSPMRIYGFRQSSVALVNLTEGVGLFISWLGPTFDGLSTGVPVSKGFVALDWLGPKHIKDRPAFKRQAHIQHKPGMGHKRVALAQAIHLVNGAQARLEPE